MKTRCRNCKKLIEYGQTYCSECFDKIKKKKKNDITQRTREADKLTKTSAWQKVRKQTMIRDNGICRLCFLRGIIEYRGLQVHHIIKRVNNPSLAYEESNLVTLCRPCHEEVEKLSPSKQRELLELDEAKIEEFRL